MDVPRQNFVGELQERCQMAYTELPEYTDESIGNIFTFSCKLRDWVCHGTGSSKKFAKQNAAKQMIDKIECEKLLLCTSEQNDGNRQNIRTPKKSSVSMLLEYCTKKKIESALFSDLPKEDGLFCCKCTLNDLSSVGKGHSKKEAKEKAAFEVAKQVGVNKYFDSLMKSEEIQKANLSPVHELTTFCQKKRLPIPIFEENEIKENNAIKYKASCCVGDLREQSGLSHSKKSAKHEVATLMLQCLKSNTPVASPVKENVEETKPVLKRKISSDSEEIVMEPLEKLVK